jgi:hypothetical protein
MIAALAFKNGYVSQREIYDKRYEVGDYDRRSHVHVLAAEREALCHAVARAIASDPEARTISLFDFGYGTGRVTNEYIETYVKQYPAGRDLRVIAYDVSSAGLKKACDRLCSKGFAPDAPMNWDPAATTGYIAGRISKTMSGVTITVVFVHGHEAQHPRVMRALALQANSGRRCMITTSWYSGIGHIPGDRTRRDYFRQLGKLTARRGEMVISVSATGDLIELQPEFAERLKTGQTDGFPINEPGDLVYETEIGQSNFYHVFSTELNDHIRAITGWRQHWWVEGIRYPGEEFGCKPDERTNYRRVLKANRAKGDRTWAAGDYQEFHTVAAFRSAHRPGPFAAATPRPTEKPVRGPAGPVSSQQGPQPVAGDLTLGRLELADRGRPGRRRPE